MASSIIHIAVANEINKKLKRDKSKLLIGTIAPDISKLIGETKLRSHFLDEENADTPNIDKFLRKYSKYLYDDFIMGYYIHLYTDYLWFKYFIPDIYNKTDSLITKLDGTVVKCNGRMAIQYMYNDYTNLNTQVIDDYGLDLEIFYNKIPTIEPIITEIPMDKLNIIVNQAGIILENSKKTKEFIFNIDNVKKFIDLSVQIISAEINKLNVRQK